MHNTCMPASWPPVDTPACCCMHAPSPFTSRCVGAVSTALADAAGAELERATGVTFTRWFILLAASAHAIWDGSMHQSNLLVI
jgi:hypothetical protein